MMEQRVRGTMGWFNEEQDFGSISTADGERLYVHRSGFVDSAPVGPCAGLAVEFEITEDDDGRRAHSVRFVEQIEPRRARRRGTRWR